MKLSIKRLEIPSHYFNAALAAALVIFYNQALWKVLIGDNEQFSWRNSFFMLSFSVFLIAVFNFFLTIISNKFTHKPFAVAIILSASLASYFMNSYGIVFDKTMVQNTIETNTSEVLDIFSMNMFYYFVLLGALPSVLILNTKVIYKNLLKECKHQSFIAFLSILVVVVNLSVFYKDYSSTFRNHREIRNLVIPSSYMYYGAKYISGAYKQTNQELEKIALDASLMDSGKDNAVPIKPLVTIIVIGETARAMNFSLNGYARQTNPALSEQKLLNFSDVTSCGTSTAVSLPCIFSSKNRGDFDTWQAKNTENLLDVLQRVGFDVMWRDNNSGCKGVCERILEQKIENFKDDQFCNTKSCFDEVLLSNLDQYLERNNKDKVIVLHQNGSHGPAYSKRYPKKFEKFTPVCKSSDLRSCSQQSIINSYDNSILYTDYFLDKVIKYLSQRNEKYTTSMLYVSDHGESLGENNLYLHGLPFYMAPKTQKKVPLIVWLSDSFQNRFKLDSNCLAAKQQQAVNHDFIFHSMLGLLKVKTALYQEQLDLFANCSTQTLSSN